jgi:hypothetical protein
MKTEAICFYETSVDFQRTTRRCIPEDRTLHNHWCENLRPCIEKCSPYCSAQFPYTTFVNFVILNSKLVQTFCVFYGTWRFVAVFKTALHLSVCSVRWIQPTLSHRRAVGIAIGYGPDGWGFDSRQRKEIVLFSVASTPALGPYQPHIQWISRR